MGAGQACNCGTACDTAEVVVKTEAELNRDRALVEAESRAVPRGTKALERRLDPDVADESRSTRTSGERCLGTAAPRGRTGAFEQASAEADAAGDGSAGADNKELGARTLRAMANFGPSERVAAPDGDPGVAREELGARMLRTMANFGPSERVAAPDEDMPPRGFSSENLSCCGSNQARVVQIQVVTPDRGAAQRESDCADAEQAAAGGAGYEIAKGDLGAGARAHAASAFAAEEQAGKRSDEVAKGGLGAGARVHAASALAAEEQAQRAIATPASASAGGASIDDLATEVDWDSAGGGVAGRGVATAAEVAEGGADVEVAVVDAVAEVAEEAACREVALQSVAPAAQSECPGDEPASERGSAGEAVGAEPSRSPGAGCDLHALGKGACSPAEVAKLGAGDAAPPVEAILIEGLARRGGPALDVHMAVGESGAEPVFEVAKLGAGDAAPPVEAILIEGLERRGGPALDVYMASGESSVEPVFKARLVASEKPAGGLRADDNVSECSTMSRDQFDDSGTHAAQSHESMASQLRSIFMFTEDLDDLDVPDGAEGAAAGAAAAVEEYCDELKPARLDAAAEADGARSLCMGRQDHSHEAGRPEEVGGFEQAAPCGAPAGGAVAACREAGDAREQPGAEASPDRHGPAASADHHGPCAAEAAGDSQVRSPAPGGEASLGHCDSCAAEPPGDPQADSLPPGSCATGALGDPHVAPPLGTAVADPIDQFSHISAEPRSDGLPPNGKEAGAVTDTGADGAAAGQSTAGATGGTAVADPVDAIEHTNAELRSEELPEVEGWARFQSRAAACVEGAGVADEPAALFKAFRTTGDLGLTFASFARLFSHAGVCPLAAPWEEEAAAACGFRYPYQAIRALGGDDWKLKKLWAHLDKRAARPEYTEAPCRTGRLHRRRCVVVGSGPCGLRSAIELRLLGARVTVLERGRRFSRINQLHIWSWCGEDVKDLGARIIEPPPPDFGANPDILAIAINDLQVFLLKVALLLGVEVRMGVEYAGNAWDPRGGWQALVIPARPSETREGRAAHAAGAGAPSAAGHPSASSSLPPSPFASQAIHDVAVLIGSGGFSSHVAEDVGMKMIETESLRKESAIGLICNLARSHGAAERDLRSYALARQFYAKMFKEVAGKIGIELENIVYVKSAAAHYFVMTPTPKSLVETGVVIDEAHKPLLSRSNIDYARLDGLVRRLLSHPFKAGEPAVLEAVERDIGGPAGYADQGPQLFDFSRMRRSSEGLVFLHPTGAEAGGGHEGGDATGGDCDDKALLVALTGDALIEPFWPEGLGIMRGFFSCLDACHAVRQWSSGVSCEETQKEYLQAYKQLKTLSASTRARTLCADEKKYALAPETRYR